MALTNCYFDINEFRRWANIPDTDDDDTLEISADAACRLVDSHCGRIFYDSGAATARTYEATSDYVMHVDDFSTTSGFILKTDNDDDGAYETTWAASAYELSSTWSPVLGSQPYNVIRAAGAATYFPRWGYRKLTVQVTARWGWATTPAAVKHASLVLAQDLWKRKDTPFGIVTGTVDFGGVRVGSNALAQVSTLLAPFRRVENVLGLA